MSDSKCSNLKGAPRPKKQRIDLIIAERGLAESPEKAQRMIMAGEVLVADQVVDKPSTIIAIDTEIRLRHSLPYVSRGGLKLEAALDEFQIDVKARTAVDVGASTGGFTDCLLQRDAKQVFAIDVGYGDLAWSLRQDPRVVVLERTNIRYLARLPVDEDGSPVKADLAVIDTSFISLKIVLPATLNLLTDRADIIALVKPQFEADKKEVAKGGVVSNPNVHERILKETIARAKRLELKIAGLTISPVRGPAGNVEFLLWMIRPTGDETISPKDNEKKLDRLIQQVLQRAELLRKSG